MKSSTGGTPIRVLHIGPRVADSGGMASVISELIRADVAGISSSAITSWSPGAGLWSLPLAIEAMRCVRKHARDPEPLVVHVHIAERGSLLREGAVAIASASMGVATVITLHGAELSFAGWSRRLLTAVVKRVDRVYCLGPSNAKDVEGLGTRTEVRVIFNPVNVDPEWPPPDQLAPSADHLVLFAGEVGVRKGFDVLADAWSRVTTADPSARLLVCGPQHRSFPIAAVDHASSMEYLGVLPRDELGALMARVDLVCLPSRAEVLPMVLLEALTVGTRVLYTRVGEYQQFEGGPGVTLIDPDSTAAVLADAIRAQLGSRQSQSERREVGRWWASRASREVVLALLRDDYRQILRAKKAPHARADR